MKQIRTYVFTAVTLLAFLFAMGYTLHHEFAKWGILAALGLQ